MLEKEWQAQVLELAARCGWDFRYHTYDSRRSASGFPDLVLVKPPRIIFAELKVGRRKVTAEQAAWLEALAACNMEYYVWYPDDLESVRDVLLS